jgi:hypothetical protein
MKITLLLILSFLGTIYAQNTSNLIVFSEDGKPFYLILNGIRQNEESKTNVKVEGLNAANYTTKIIFSDTKLGEIQKKYLMVQDADGNFAEVTYAIKEKKGEYKLKWRSSVTLAQAPVYVGEPVIYSTIPKPEIGTVIITETVSTSTSGQEGVNINMDMNVNEGAINSGVYVEETIIESSSSSVNGGTVSQTTTTTTQAGGVSDNVGISVNVGGVNMGVGINVNDGVGVSQTTTSTITTSSSSTYQTGGNVVIENQPQYYIPGYIGAIGCNGAPMSPENFNRAKNSIKAKSFSDSKMTLAKQITNTNCLTSQQAKEITELFNFEDDRLEFTKLSYSSIYDLDNFYIVNDAFEFESSIEELDEYIRR